MADERRHGGARNGGGPDGSGRTAKEDGLLLYDAISPGPRSLRMFILEKGLTLPSLLVDVFAGENREAPYLRLNPAGQTPALRLRDGTTIGESVAIAEYLEELYPEPALIGRTAEERAETRQWWRRIELNVTEFIHNSFHYAEGIARFRPRIPIVPEGAEGMKQVARDRLQWLDRMFGAGPCFCGQRFTAADIWLYVWLDFGGTVAQPFDHDLPNIGPWFDRIAARPSAEASRELLNQAQE